MIVSGRPELRFDMLSVGHGGVKLVASEIQKLFGKENYDDFRKVGKKGQPVPEEIKQRVDREIYDRYGEGLWVTAMKRANSTVDYARRIHFADQEKQATLLNDIVWDRGRPSVALERLTKSTRWIGRRLKHEQGRQLGLGLLCAEEMAGADNGYAEETLDRLNKFLEAKSFVGKEGETQRYEIYSYHEPFTNRLVGLSSKHPDSQYREQLWVKSLDYPVRMIGIRHQGGKVGELTPALYDPRGKDIESAVIKGMRKSLKTSEENRGLIETSPHVKDQVGFRLVVMGGRSLRDRVTADMEQLLWEFDGVRAIEPDNRVDPNPRRQNRVEFRRRQVYIEGLRNPLELIVYGLEDWITSEYEVGEFDEGVGMHDGSAHDLHKLDMVADVAPSLWPVEIFGIDLARAKKSASFEYATRLGRKERISPSPYEGEN